MDLICYVHPSWKPRIRAAEATRPWMTDTPESFAYRCLPLNIANAHGWELLSPCAFDATWSGGGSTADVTIRIAGGAKVSHPPVSIFGQGILTFNIEGLFRTPPGWNLWVGGSPNHLKDGIGALTGVVETDWAPYTFTMNWRFTRPGHTVHFDEGEPICFFFPVQRAYLDQVAPQIVPMEANAELVEQFQLWSKSRDEFQKKVSRQPPAAPADKWQKHYYQGADMRGQGAAAGHQTKMKLAAFETRAAAKGTPPLAVATPAPIVAAAAPVPTAPASAPLPEGATSTALRKRDWLLHHVESRRDLSPEAVHIERRIGLSAQEFLDKYYALNRPVILAGEMQEWPALTLWTPEYLRRAVGSRMVEFQGGRTKNERFEMQKDLHRTSAPFEQFLDLITASGGNDAYITAYNCERNHDALSVLNKDVRPLDKFLSGAGAFPNGMMWIGPAGTVTSLHHDVTDNFIAQVVGRKRFKIVPAADVGKLYNHKHVFSEVPNLEDPALDRARYSLLDQIRVYDVTIMPGEIMYMPLAWWHQVHAVDFSVTITYTNFRWPNDSYKDYPAD